MPHWKKDIINSSNHKITTFSIGDGKQTLLVIHGGPGTSSTTIRDTHDCYAKLGFKVVTWDQLGCGASDCKNDDSLWTLERFSQECQDVIKQLDIKNIHLLGRSWGGILAIEHVLKDTDNIRSLIVGSTTCNIPLMQSGLKHLKVSLGMDVYQMMSKCETEDNTNNPEYQSILKILKHRYLCRLERWPKVLNSTPSYSAKRSMEIIFG